jgi:hypothetical protein
VIGGRPPITSPRSFLVAAILAPLTLALASACASAPPGTSRTLPPADDTLKARVLDAWGAALRRADSLGPSRILYDAKFGKGPVRLPGNLTVYAGRLSLTARASGPFGSEFGSYEDGTYTGKAGGALFLDPTVLRGVLAGVWRGGAPEVAGADSEEGLLRWESGGSVAAEGRLDISEARLKSLRVGGKGGEIRAEFSGPFDPWPEVISLVDRKSGRALKLRRVIVEPIQED